MLEKYGADGEQDTALSFCQLVGERADESWSDKSISKLLHYARNHPDPEPGKLNIHSDSDENSDEVTVDVLFVNAAYCVRGAAAIAISRLLWKHNDRLEQVRSSIESLVSDPHPAVRMAAIEAIKVVFNIDKDLAVSWFCKACRDDLRVAVSPRAFPLFNYIVPSHIDQVGPVIQHMAASSLDEVAFMGAQQVTARWLFDCFFENEFATCCQGTVPQRKGVARVATALLHNKKYSPQCQQILCKFMNDPDKEVRDELRGMFRNQNLIIDTECTALIKAYIESLAFADDPNHFVLSLSDLTGSLIPVAEVVFTVCDRFFVPPQEKNHLMTLEVSSILLRLYESAQGGQKIQITDRCLDTWDLLFENRVEMAMGLTRNIEQ